MDRIRGTYGRSGRKGTYSSQGGLAHRQDTRLLQPVRHRDRSRKSILEMRNDSHSALHYAVIIQSANAQTPLYTMS